MSRFGSDPRSSGSNVGYGGSTAGAGAGGGGGGGGERWDPERFTRERERYERSRAPPVIERERFEEHDHFDPRGRGSGSRRPEISTDDFYFSGRPGGRGERYEEKDVFIRDERYGPPARRPVGGPQRYYDEEVDSVDINRSSGPMVPFDRHRRQSINAERGYGPPARRPAGMPGLIRRQSSLDTFDRKPMPRYGDRLREPPETIVVPVAGRRRRSPPRFFERDYDEEIRIAEPEYYGDEEFRGYKEREVSTLRRRRAGSEVDFREKESFEVEEEPERPFPRKGKTKMPRRLVNKRAIIELGYAFEEEDETIIILKALGKEHIDEVIRISKEMNEKVEKAEKGSESRTITYVIEGPPPPPEIIEQRTTEIVITPPPPSEIPRSVREWDVLNDIGRSEKSGGHSEHGGGHSERGVSHTSRAARSERGGGHIERESVRSEKRSLSPVEITRQPSHSRRGSHSRRRSRSTAAPKSEYFEEEIIGESNSMHGPLALIAPKERRDERSIKAEIRALEAEKKMLKYEREAEREHRKVDRYKDGEIIIERGRDVKIEKDRKVPDQRILKAMLATLT